MKKLILSLAALAMISVGAVSCGSDDGGTNPNPNPTPVDDTPIVTGNSFSWGGSSYEVDTTTTGVIINSEGSIVPYNIGTEEEPVIATRWIFITHDGEWQTADNAVWTQVFIPVDGDTALWPHEADEFYLLATEVVVGGDSVADPEGITAFSIGVNVWDEEGETINYTTSTTFAEGVVSLNYDGFMDGPYGFTLSASSSTSVKSSVSASQLTNMKINTNEIQKVEKRNLVKISK